MTIQRKRSKLTTNGRKTKADPTGQSRNRKRATKALQSRLNRARRKVLDLFDEIPYETRNVTKAVNHLQVNELVYEYQLTGQQFAALASAIQAILDGDLETASVLMPEDWFYKEFIEAPYRQGTMEDIRDIARAMSEAQNAGIIEVDPFRPELTPEAFVLSEGYRKNIQTSYAVNYERVKTLSSTTAKQVFTQIQLGIDAGVNSRTIRREIMKRFDVSKTNAQRIARTETNAAYNNAKLDTTALAAEQLELDLGVMHISALTPTTRQSHAARHGLAYSTADERTWWNSGANRINCLCTTQTVVLDSTGKMVNVELQDKVREEGKEFFE